MGRLWVGATGEEGRCARFRLAQHLTRPCALRKRGKGEGPAPAGSHLATLPRSCACGRAAWARRPPPRRPRPRLLGRRRRAAAGRLPGRAPPMAAGCAYSRLRLRMGVGRGWCERFPEASTGARARLRQVSHSHTVRRPAMQALRHRIHNDQSVSGDTCGAGGPSCERFHGKRDLDDGLLLKVAAVFVREHLMWNWVPRAIWTRLVQSAHTRSPEARFRTLATAHARPQRCARARILKLWRLHLSSSEAITHRWERRRQAVPEPTALADGAQTKQGLRSNGRAGNASRGRRVCVHGWMNHEMNRVPRMGILHLHVGQIRGTAGDGPASIYTEANRIQTVGDGRRAGLPCARRASKLRSTCETTGRGFAAAQRQRRRQPRAHAPRGKFTPKRAPGKSVRPRGSPRAIRRRSRRPP